MKVADMRRWTRGEYDKMIAAGVFAAGDRVELVDGEILQMTPQGSVHAATILILQDALRLAFGSGFSVRPQLPLALSPDSEPEPDLAVVPGSPRDYLHGHPGTALLALEVSDSSLEYDRETKGRLYARAGIEDYWIVNLIDRSIEVFRKPWQEEYRSVQIYFPGDIVTPLGAPQAGIQVTDVFGR
jgi:Uma2 family endonuclease